MKQKTSNKAKKITDAEVIPIIPLHNITQTKLQDPRNKIWTTKKGKIIHLRTWDEIKDQAKHHKSKQKTKCFHDHTNNEIFKEAKPSSNKEHFSDNLQNDKTFKPTRSPYFWEIKNPGNN